MVKIVVNRCYGGFGLSPLAKDRLINCGAPKNDQSDAWRTEPALVRVVEELGAKASDKYACLEVVEIPDDVEWEIDERDGWEVIREKHRTW